MDTGIGATSTGNAYRVVSYNRNGRFESGLYGRFVVMFLTLPAMKASTVVFDNRRVATVAIF
jgi:hypothetical protein